LELSQANGSAATNEATLKQLKESAVKFLRSGFSSAREKREINESVATGGLYLAQSLLNDGKFAEAIKLLEDPQFGPLTLVTEENPAAAREGYSIEVYKAALRAYVSVSPPQGNKAVETMDALERSVDDSSGQAADQLTRIYVGLGIALQQQLGELRSAGRDADAERVAAAFSEFLDRIAARQEGASWAIRSWIAQTYYNMATGQRAGSSPTPTPTASAHKPSKELLTKARDALRELLKKAAAAPNYAPGENAILAAKLQLGECYRELGQYKPALNLFSSILKEKETSLSVQRAAALTYQQRGDAENHAWYERAIYGGHKLKSTGKNRIWGWLKLAQVAERAARSNPTFLDTFFEARLNAARCRYLAGLKQKGAARTEDLAKAKQSLRSMLQLYPDLGGDRWRGEFDSLLKSIQKETKQEQVGLQEFKTTQS
jgi:tetratricopeptide (TPR) repeat protein